ncbi:hypothetical protein ATG_05630 [Desulfurococcaceae archaeon AG1]|nr:MAG: hypothetical protein DJ555_07270 [Desulfurococcaceae archaeon]GAY25360.1 hypothetical protein ATG_05630 [Desulfurococcaceae archaeon AG1]
MAKCVTRSVSRLHITLIDLIGRLGRIDGGAGVTLSEPSFVVSAQILDHGSIEFSGGMEYRDIAITCANRYLARACRSCGARIEVIRGYELHVGLGGVTQLCLSIAKSLSASMGLDEDPIELAKIVGRGGTSGIGTYSFKLGGFIVDAGHSYPTEKQLIGPSDQVVAPPPPMITRIEIPENWRFVLVRPLGARKIYGDLERRIFEEGRRMPEEEVWRVSHILLMGLIPSVKIGDIELFKRSIGMIQEVGFKKIEWLYQDKSVWSIRKKLLLRGIEHGLSSMGPTIYIPCRENECEEISSYISDEKSISLDIVKGSNRGADTIC